MDNLSSFNTFSPKVLAGIGQPLPDTVADRSLPIRMERRLQSEDVERLRLRDVEPELAPLREELAAWASQETVNRLSKARPFLPSAVTNDRLLDVTEPLFAIAELAGGGWLERLVAAIVEVADVDARCADDELALLALRHVAELFTSRRVDQLSTEEILNYMIARDDGPWAEWWGDRVEAGKNVAPARRLSKLLDRFEGVEPKAIREGRATPRGYLRGPVDQAVRRYLPHLSATSATPATPLPSMVAGVAGVANALPAWEQEAFNNVLVEFPMAFLEANRAEEKSPSATKD
jgi:hypothetical protein